MPTFGRRNSKPNNYVYSYKGRKIRQMTREDKWNVGNSELKVVNARLGKRLLAITATLPKRANRPNVIVEWGCGNGNALFALAKKHPDKVFVGFSDESHAEWAHKPKNVTLLHTTTDALEKLSSFGSVKGKVDLMYTHFGLQHLDLKPLIKHLVALKKVVAINGKIIMRPNELKYLNQNELAQLVKALEENGYKATTMNYQIGKFEAASQTDPTLRGMTSLGLIELERIH
jgi:hypothetical protein